MHAASISKNLVEHPTKPKARDDLEFAPAVTSPLRHCFGFNSDLRESGNRRAPRADAADGALPAGSSKGPAAKGPAAKIDPLDWPHWRGPAQNSISRETGLIDNWDPDAEGTSGNVLWKNTELGGINTPIVMNGKLYTIVRADPGTNSEGEKVVCVDALTGKKLWENKYNVFLTDVPAERIGWASITGDPTTGKIYALGACGFSAMHRRRNRQDLVEPLAQRRVWILDDLWRTPHHAGAV